MKEDHDDLLGIPIATPRELDAIEELEEEEAAAPAATPRRFSLNTDPKRTLEQEVDTIATALVRIAGLARFPGDVMNEDTLGRIAAFFHAEIDTHIAAARIAMMQRGLGRSRFSLDGPPPVRPEVPLQRQVIHAPGVVSRGSGTPAEPKLLGRLVGAKQSGVIEPVVGVEIVRPERPSPTEVPDETQGIKDAGFIDD